MKWLSRLFNLCSHRFSWPRTGANGQDYQVCLLCGRVFDYDWGEMKRTGEFSLDDRTQRTSR